MPSFHVMRTIVIVFFFALAFSPFSPFMGSSPCFISLCWKSWQEKNVNFTRVNARWFWQEWTMFTFVVPLLFLLSQGLIVVNIESSSSSSCQHWHCANHHDLLLPAFPLQDSALHRICGGIPNHSYWQDPEVCHEVIFQSSIIIAAAIPSEILQMSWAWHHLIAIYQVKLRFWLTILKGHPCCSAQRKPAEDGLWMSSSSTPATYFWTDLKTCIAHTVPCFWYHQTTFPTMCNCASICFLNWWHLQGISHTLQGIYGALFFLL